MQCDANGKTWTTPTYLKDWFEGNILKTFFKKSLRKLFILFYHGLFKIFQTICNFQKFWSLFISIFSVKKHMLQCLMSVFERFLFIE
jgi:hypothetical protein